MVEQDVAPAGGGGYAPLAPGRGRTPPGHTRVPCEELADGVDLRESWPKARTGPVRRRDGAPRGAAHPGRCAHLLKGRADRRSIPSAFEGEKACPREGGEEVRLPGAIKNTGGEALAV